MHDVYRQAGTRDPQPHYPAPGDTYTFDNICCARILSVSPEGLCHVEFITSIGESHYIHIDDFKTWTLEWVPETKP